MLAYYLLLLLLMLQYFPGGARAESDIAKYLEMNTSIQKLGYSFSVPSYRTRIDRCIMRNLDLGEPDCACWGCGPLCVCYIIITFSSST